MEKGGKLMLASPFFSSLLARPPIPPKGNLLIIRINQGMDSTLGLNPWLGPRPDPRDLFLDEDYPVLPQAGGSDIHLGPSAQSLEAHARDVSVVSGIYTGSEDDLGHEAHRRYMATGFLERNYPHFIAWPAQLEGIRLGKRVPVIFSDELEVVDLSLAQRVHVGSFVGQAMGENERAVLRASGFSDGVTSFAKGLRSLASRNLGGRGTLLVNRLSWLREEVGGNLEPEHVALGAMSLGLVHFAQIDWNDFPGLDTHRNFPGRHQRFQRQAWDRVGTLLNVMKKTPYKDTGQFLFPDHTTLAVTTEFSRPPFLNAQEGKDHNALDNSILLGGRGIRGGLHLGGHHLFVREERRAQSQLSGLPLNYETGETLFPSGDLESLLGKWPLDIIRPENILQTLGDIFGTGPLFGRGIWPLGKIRRPPA